MMATRTLWLTLVLASACGGASVPTLDTGLPRSTPANQVTPTEAQAACQAYEDLANASLGADVQQQLSCVMQGLASQWSGGASCTTTQATCLASAPTGTDLDFNCELSTTFAPSGCTATIGQLEDCVNAVSHDIDAFTRQVNCSLASDLQGLVDAASAAAAIGTPTDNPACASLPVQCLDLLGWAADATPELPQP